MAGAEIVRTAQEGAAFLERYNRFHDAFISSVSAYSTDRFVDDASQPGGYAKEVSRELTVMICLAHRNYRPGPASPDEGLQLALEKVTEFSVARWSAADASALDLTGAEITPATGGLKLLLKGDPGGREILSAVFGGLRCLKVRLG